MCARCARLPRTANIPRGANAPTRWAAYSNERECAKKGLDFYDKELTAYGGFVGQPPEDVKLRYPDVEDGSGVRRKEASNHLFDIATPTGHARLLFRTQVFN